MSLQCEKPKKTTSELVQLSKWINPNDSSADISNQLVMEIEEFTDSLR